MVWIAHKFVGQIFRFWTFEHQNLEENESEKDMKEESKWALERQGRQHPFTGLMLL